MAIPSHCPWYLCLQNLLGYFIITSHGYTPPFTIFSLPIVSGLKTVPPGFCGLFVMSQHCDASSDVFRHFVVMKLLVRANWWENYGFFSVTH